MKTHLFSLILAATFAAGSELSTTQYHGFSKGSDAFSQKRDGLSDEQLDLFILGKSFFRIPWVEAPSATTARDGLGPLFNANTCTGCHPGNGPAALHKSDASLSRTAVLRLSRPSDGSDTHKALLAKTGFIPDPVYGDQLSFSAVFGIDPEGRAKVHYQKRIVTFPDGEQDTLYRPVVTLRDLRYKAPDQDTVVSLRKSPALVGMGLLEAISDEAIAANADEHDLDGDGISGRINRVYSKQTQSYETGRYTYKASVATLKHQVAGAARNDMSLTSPLYPNENCTPAQQRCNEAPRGIHDFDLPQSRMDAIAFYLANMKVPQPTLSEGGKEGKKLFTRIGCVSCHVDRFDTPLGSVSPYSDLLLHDMGAGLSDGRREFDATAREWRTAPLWGISLYEAVTGNPPRYLHDGRAKTLQEAILWHGGEATQSKTNYMHLDKKQRQKLLRFLGEL